MIVHHIVASWLQQRHVLEGVEQIVPMGREYHLVCVFAHSFVVVFNTRWKPGHDDFDEALELERRQKTAA